MTLTGGTPCILVHYTAGYKSEESEINSRWGERASSVLMNGRTGSGAHKVSSKMNIGLFYPRRICIGSGAILSTRLYLVSRPRMRGVVTPFQHTSSRHLPQGITQTSSYFCVPVNYIGVFTIKPFVLRRHWVLNVLYCLESKSWPEKHFNTHFLSRSQYIANPLQKISWLISKEDVPT